MFKKTKGGSSFKSGTLSSSAVEKKAILEDLGYAFDSVTKKSGWNWSTSSAGSDSNQPTEGEAIDDAWDNAGERARSAMDIPAATWARMTFKEQAELIQEALSGH